MVAQPVLFPLFALLGLWLTIADLELLALISFGLGALSFIYSFESEPVAAVPGGPAAAIAEQGLSEQTNGVVSKRLPIVCKCGHKGFIALSGTDRPYSSPAETYVLEGFGGDTVTVTNVDDTPDDLLAYLDPKCPACGRTGSVKYGIALGPSASMEGSSRTANGRVGAG
jgi:hypothetical protein